MGAAPTAPTGLPAPRYAVGPCVVAHNAPSSDLGGAEGFAVYDRWYLSHVAFSSLSRRACERAAERLELAHLLWFELAETEGGRPAHEIAVALGLAERRVRAGLMAMRDEGLAERDGRSWRASRELLRLAWRHREPWPETVRVRRLGPLPPDWRVRPPE